ncbi:MAG: hypothetical protein L3J79_09520, partial [Candidatus Marinimicrobia bacterium]|nr:hypothetical protein [Candidatus Neomarinimicrobiota bacterium]
MATGTGNKYKFTGKERDSELGLDYSWHRFYDWEVGRFTQVDPLWQEYPSSSPYVYVANNPLKYVDLTGLYQETDFIFAEAQLINIRQETICDGPICNFTTQYFAATLGVDVPMGLARQMKVEFFSDDNWILLEGATSEELVDMVNGAGDGDNFLFSMETNMGRLRTAAMFDYENNASSYSIRVAVSDSYGLSTEQSFTVTLTDVIENLPPVDLNSSAELS